MTNEMVNEEEDTRNEARLTFDRRTFQRFLHLPDGVRVVGAKYDRFLDVVEVAIEGPTLPLVAAGAVPPRVRMVIGIK
jgi:hypothetical protein